MKDKTAKQSAQNIALQDIALRSASYIQQPELLSPDDPLLAIFESVVEIEPEMDDRRVRKDWDCSAWSHGRALQAEQSQSFLTPLSSISGSFSTTDSKIAKSRSSGDSNSGC